MSIHDTLAERQKSYGSFLDQSRISQRLMEAMIDTPKWSSLDPDMVEALSIIAVKIARILNGNPWFHDSWHDISGYATLVADRLQGTTAEPSLDKQVQMIWGTPEGMVDDE